MYFADRPDMESIWSAQPGVLPGRGDSLVVATKGGVGAVTVAEFEGLMFSDGNRSGSSDAGV